MSELLQTALTSLIETSNDAQANLYKVIFHGGILDSEYSDLVDHLTVRCSGIEPPMATQDKYTVRYITAYVDRPVTKIGLSRTFSLTFRMDSYWEVYKVLLDLKKKFSHASKGWATHNYMSDGSIDEDKFFNVDVNYLEEASTDDSETGEALYRFNHCWIESITPPSFDTNSSDPVTVTCQINFLEMEDIQSGMSDSSEYTSSMISNVSGASYK